MRAPASYDEVDQQSLDHISLGRRLALVSSGVGIAMMAQVAMPLSLMI